MSNSNNIGKDLLSRGSIKSPGEPSEEDMDRDGDGERHRGVIVANLMSQTG